MSRWHELRAEWVAAGRPTDLPPVELAVLRLADAAEADDWRERERLAMNAELLAAAHTLIRMLRGVGCRPCLGARGEVRCAGGRERWEPYLPEMQALREPIALILRVEAADPY